MVFYKFKSAKDFDTCTFDGTGISVFDLKREIIQQKRLTKALDFDLFLYNAQTNDEYDQDSTIIHRNTSVLVARLPIEKGKQNAQRYLTMAMPLQAKQVKTVYQKIKPDVSQDKDGISLMFKQQAEQWQQTQDQMQKAVPVFRNPGGGKYRPMMDMVEPQRPPPPGYTCFRCGEKGHYINMCPTIGDESFDNKPKIKRATGIPTMFLKTIQNKDSIDRGLMVTQEGDLVVAMPNEYF